ncbi:MAG: N-acetylmuramoyl-L-alanine amidase [Hymenobacteraceae bacterium]|nr:N-acetylmuramoyl-L-alanine amidase [Hymenobacteraceae bacterium]
MVLAARPYKVRTVVIDAGHGGKDRGCNGKEAYEADVALKLALALGRRIEDSMPGVKVLYTRKTDVFVELIERAEIANRAAADVFISIHLNSGPAAARGTEIWTMGPAKSDANLVVAKRENAVVLQESDYKKNYGGFDPRSPQSHILFSLFQSAYIENSLRFAQAADRQLRAAARPSRGVKQAGFIVLWKTTMPAVLIEAGFLTNPQDEKLLNTSAGQTYTAAALFKAFKSYKQQLEALD